MDLGLNEQSGIGHRFEPRVGQSGGEGTSQRRRARHAHKQKRRQIG